MFQEPDHPAFLGIAGDDRRPIGPTFQERIAGGQIKLALGLLATMALDALLGQERSDALFENFETASHLLGVIGRD
jgi:hypothetical protein